MILRSPKSLAFDEAWEPLRKSHYMLELVDLNGSNMPQPTGFEIFSVSGVESVIETRQYKPVNSGFEIPIGFSASSVSIGMRFFKDKKLFEWFTAWFTAIYDPEHDTFGIYDNIVGSGKLKLFGPSKRSASEPGPPTEPLYTIELMDAYPKKIGLDQLSSDDDGTSPASWSVTLSCVLKLPKKS